MNDQPKSTPSSTELDVDAESSKALGADPDPAAELENPDDIVGHKTFQNGPLSFRHEPLRRHETDVLLAHIEQENRRRVEEMPDERAALCKLFDAWLRLKELGWKEACYCPKDGSSFRIIEIGSTGTFDAHYSGEWPDGYIISSDDYDSYVSRPGSVILCKVENTKIAPKKEHANED